MILQADIRINFETLNEVLRLVVEDRLLKVDECWLCAKHENPFECKKNRACLEYIKSKVKNNCNCCSVDSFCENCNKFANMYDLSCALQCQRMIMFYTNNGTTS